MLSCQHGQRVDDLKMVMALDFQKLVIGKTIQVNRTVNPPGPVILCNRVSMEYMGVSKKVKVELDFKKEKAGGGSSQQSKADMTPSA
jgi:hypothetical protein